MRKRIFLLLTLIGSLFAFSGTVEAAYKELTCIYEGGTKHPSTMLVQNSSGKLFAYTSSEDITDRDSDTWYTWDNFKLYGTEAIEDMEFYNENDFFTRCAKYVKHDTFLENGRVTHAFYFSDETQAWWFDYELVHEYNSLPKKFDFELNFFRDNMDEYNKIINETEWNSKCTYFKEGASKIYLYFNKEKYILIDEDESFYSYAAKFNLSKIWDSLDQRGCPPSLFRVKPLLIVNPSLIDGSYYFSGENGGEQYTLIAADSNVQTVRPYPPLIINDCEDLFGSNLVKKINDIMDLIKIVVPILLIAFGIIDFTKAVFSGSVEDMSKCQKKFLKRIVAAILVFLAPIFINLILTLANEVWGNISPDSCIKQND